MGAARWGAMAACLAAVVAALALVAGAIGEQRRPAPALPAVTGALCRRWYTAITLATLPTWVALGVFATLAAPRLGFAYLTQDTHAAGVIGTLELFAGMGLLGWIMRLAAKDGLARLEGSR